jgi:hypothetical protein
MSHEASRYFATRVYAAGKSYPGSSASWRVLLEHPVTKTIAQRAVDVKTEGQIFFLPVATLCAFCAHFWYLILSNNEVFLVSWAKTAAVWTSPAM